MTHKRLLGVWRSMHNRCYNTNQKSYRDYGARGIRVHQSWHGAAGFQQFLKDMGSCPNGHTLERTDNDADYGPGNCRWASRLEQAQNKRNSRKLTLNGKTQTLAAWARQLGCTPGAITARLAAGLSETEALTRPIPVRPNSKLTEEGARYIKANYPVHTAARLAAHLGVSKKTVLNVIHERTFKDVRGEP